MKYTSILFKSLVKSVLVATSVVAVSAVSATSASAVPTLSSPFTFGNIAGGDTVGDSYNGGFNFDVVQDGTSNVIFKISNTNATPTGIFIGRVFFDSPTSLLSSPTANVQNSGSVNFSLDGSPGNLPQGANINWGNGVTDFSFTRVNGQANKWAVQNNETLGIKFTGNYNNVVTALNTGTLRLGLHVQNINGGSDSYVNNTGAVPEPFTILGVGTAIGFGSFFKKHLGKSKSK